MRGFLVVEMEQIHADRNCAVHMRWGRHHGGCCDIETDLHEILPALRQFVGFLPESFVRL